MSRMERGLGIWQGVALMGGALLLQACAGGGPPPNLPSPTVPSAAVPASPNPTPSPSPPKPTTPVPTSRGKAFPMLGVELKGETMPIENGQRLPLGEGLFAEVFVVPFPPTPETDLHLFLFQGERPINGAEMRVVYDMIDMDHGALDKQIGREVEAGHYAAFLDMFMFGDWVADVAISHPQFDYTLKVLLAVQPWRKTGR